MMSDSDRVSHTTMVLVAEDEPLVLKLVSVILARAGYDVLPAADGREARRMFNDHAHELVLLIVDIAMPKVSGADLISQLPTLIPRIPVLFMTGLGENEVKERLRGEFPVLYKPFTALQLLQAVDGLAEEISAATVK